MAHPIFEVEGLILDNASYVRYLLVLKRLHKAGGIKSADLARALNVTKTSVHSMMNNFIDLNYVEKERGGLVFLTQAGLQQANCYEELYNRIAAALFSDCDTDPSAEKAMCALIAELSEDCKTILMQNLTTP